MKSVIPDSLAVLSAACGLAFSTTAAAQGAVTLYGIGDHSVRYQDNATAAAGSTARSTIRRTVSRRAI